MADDIARLGYEIDSSQAVKAAKDLDLMAASAMRADKAASSLAAIPAGRSLNGMAQAASAAKVGADRMTHSLTNASFQVQDFAVQVASGQSALMAFAQQFPQLAGAIGFSGKAGLYGALIGTAAAIGVSLYTALADATDAVKTFNDALDASEKQIDEWRSAADLATAPWEKLAQQFGTSNDALRQALFDLAAIEKIKAYEAIDATTASMAELIGTTGVWNAETNRIVQGFLGFTRNSEEARVAAYNFSAALAEMNSTLDPSVRLASALDLRKQLEAATGGYKNMNTEQRTLYEGLTKVIVQLQMMGVRTDDAANSMSAYGSAASKAQAFVDGLTGKTNALAAAAWNAANGMAAFGNAQVDAASDAVFGADAPGRVPSGLGNFGLNPLGQGLAPGKSNRPKRRPVQMDEDWGWSDPSGGGGGGGSTDTFAEDLKRLQDNLMTERETIDAWYAESQTILNDRRALEIMGEQAHKDALLDLEYQYQEKLRGIKDAGDQYGLQSTADYFGELSALAGGKYEGLLRIQRSFAAASALVNTYQAASQALADPTLTYWQKFAAVAKVLAAGFGFVNAIKSGGSSSGGGGGGSGGATTSATRPAADTAPTKTTRIELMGDDWIVNLVEPVLDQVFKESKNGTRVIWDRA